MTAGRHDARQAALLPARRGAALLYQGLLASTASWARAGRGLVSALLARGEQVAAVRVRGFGYDPSFGLPDGLPVWSPAAARRLPLPDLGFGFLAPHQSRHLRGRRRLLLLVWEADRIPVEWATALRGDSDLLVGVPSRFTADALAAGGIPAERIRRVPLGFAPDLATAARARRAARLGAGGADPGAAVFQVVATPHWRKGVDEVLAAYSRAFAGRSDVLLRIQTPYDPARRRRRFPFEIPGWHALLERHGLVRAAAPAVELHVGSLPDSALSGIYADADVVVAPSWGESFGLVILEAMAAGLPVIATDWGGHLEFVPEGEDRIPTRLVEGGDRLYHLAPGARVAPPDVEALVARLRWHAEHPAASRRRGVENARAVAGWTWEAAAAALAACTRHDSAEHDSVGHDFGADDSGE